MIKLIILLSLIFLTVFPLSETMAETNTLVSKEQLQLLGFTEYESINPNSLLYQFKRLGEEAKLFYIFDEGAKKIYLSSLIGVRFNELIFVINFKKTGFLTETVNRYNVFIGKTKAYNKKVVVKSNQVQKFIVVLEKLRDMYPANSSYWLSIQQAIDTTRGLL